jgi:Glucosidase II beta subunit-like protein
MDDDTAVVMEVGKRLAQLVDICAQLHKGWWSYEWCYARQVAQFHIHVQETDIGPNFRLEDFTKLGKKSHRVVKLLTGKHKDRQHAPNDLAQGLNELARVEDTYRDGDLCPDTQQPRVTHVNLICCSQRILELRKTTQWNRPRAPTTTTHVAENNSLQQQNGLLVLFVIVAAVCSFKVTQPRRVRLKWIS